MLYMHLVVFTTHSVELCFAIEFRIIMFGHSYISRLNDPHWATDLFYIYYYKLKMSVSPIFRSSGWHAKWVHFLFSSQFSVMNPPNIPYLG